MRSRLMNYNGRADVYDELYALPSLPRSCFQTRSCKSFQYVPSAVGLGLLWSMKNGIAALGHGLPWVSIECLLGHFSLLGTVRATRKPRSLLHSNGWSQYRNADRQSAAMLLQQPPRNTRVQIILGSDGSVMDCLGYSP